MFIPPRPIGDDCEARGLQALWDNAWGTHRKTHRDTPNAKWNYFPDGTDEVIVKPPQSSAGDSGIHWQTPKKELDPTISVSENTLVFISPQNPLCTVGLTDLQTGTILMATAGEWLCVKDCPAATVAGYNVPQDPFPGYNTSAPSGTPLAGDADAPTVFWILQKSAC